jgi:hypothetical protein
MVLVFEQGALAQSTDDRGGFAVRELGLSTGYAWVQLPPITLGGKLPNDVLNEDLITSGTVDIDWRRDTSRTTYSFDLFGMYSTRTRYSRLSAPGADASFRVSRALGNRWRLGTGVAGAITSSDQVTFQPTQTRRLVDDAQSFDDLARTVAVMRSPSPDLSQAALFVPIRESPGVSELYRSRVASASVRADATYAHSVRLSTHFSGVYTNLRRISPRQDPGLVLSLPDSTAEGARMAVTYARSERTQLTAALNWSQISGIEADRVVSATLGYGWYGRKWFAEGTAGAALRPFQTLVAAIPSTTTSSRTPLIVGSAAVGYKFQTQTLLVRYSRAAHDEASHGARNIVTGFGGNVQWADGSWSWSAPQRQWMAQSDFSMVRRPGNFSYIYTWLATFGLGRRLTPNVRLMGELLFDRHGSRGFEGFHIARQGARVNFLWTPRRRTVEQEPFGSPRE